MNKEERIIVAMFLFGIPTGSLLQQILPGFGLYSFVFWLIGVMLVYCISNE